MNVKTDGMVERVARALQAADSEPFNHDYTVGEASDWGLYLADTALRESHHAELVEALIEACDQLWHLAKDGDENYLVKRIDATLAKLHPTTGEA